MTTEGDVTEEARSTGPGAPAAGQATRGRRPGAAMAGLTSVGAGTIHAAATGIHAEHATLAWVFAVLALAQIGAGLVSLARPGRAAAVAVAAVNAAAVAGWVLTRTSGVPWIEGLEVAEAPQLADTVAAGLGAVATGAALVAIVAGRREGPAPRLVLPGAVVAVLVVPAMAGGGTHVHTTEHDHASIGPADATATTVHDDGHDHDEQVVPAGGVPSSAAPTTAAAPAAAPWPRPWDPAQPIDLAGVAGVTAEQEARAVALVEGTLRELPRYADVAAAEAAGYRSIGDAGTGSEHYLRRELIDDSVLLDPTQPESLVYTVVGDRRVLAGAMYIASARPLDDPELLDWAGPLMQWHNHGNLCWDQVDGVPQVVGVLDGAGRCARGVNTGGANPMVHVWVTPHECGVFAALEGVGAGQTAVPEDQRVDRCHAAHDHG